jgi:GAF domain-containing protein
MEQTSDRVRDVSRRLLAEGARVSPIDLPQVLALIPRLSAGALHARTAILRLVQEDTAVYDQVYRFDLAEPETPATAEEILAELTRRETVPILIPDLLEDPRFSPHAPGRSTSAISAPLIQHQTLVGTICVFDRIPGEAGEPAVFEERDVKLLVTLSTEAGIAIEHARLHKAAVRRGEQMEALLRSFQSVTSGLDLQQILDRIIAEAARIADTRHVKILLLEEARQTLRVASAVGGTVQADFPAPLGRSLSGTVASTGQPLFVTDSQDESQNPNAAFDREHGLRTYLGIPVKGPHGVLGVLTFNTTESREYRAEELAYLTSFADQAAIAIENARLYNEARERSARFRALTELSRKVTASLDLQQVFDYAVQAAVNLLDLALARLWVWQEASGVLCVGASAGDADLLLPPRETYGPTDGVIGIAFRTLEVMTVSDPESDPRFLEQAWARRVGLRRFAYIPVRLGERAAGVLSVARRTIGDAFQADDIELLTSFAQNVAIGIENARLFREKERLAVEELLRLRKLSVLNEIGSVMQGTMHVDALLRVALTGATYGGGLGFNRAIVLLVDDQQQVLLGRMGVGPSSGAEAGEIWEALTSQPRPLIEVMAQRAALRQGLEESAFDRLARSLRIPLDATGSVLARTAAEGRPFRVTGAQPYVHPAWEGRLEVNEFACAPLLAKGKVVGVLVVDNKFNARPITDEDMEFLSALATQAGLAVENARVYTSLEDANREIQRTHHRLLQQERLAALGEMSAHVVHEIRNPLVAIGGFARRLAQRLAGREPEGQYAQIVAREVDRLERIIQDVRGLSRESRLTLAETDLHALLQECLVLFAERVALQHVSVRLELAQFVPILRLDVVQMKQAVLNLVANALEAMPAGGTLTLTTALSREEHTRAADVLRVPTAGDRHTPAEGEPAALTAAAPGAAAGSPTRWVALSVGDTGGGIPEDILDEVFNPFFTTKEIGTGLGLTLVRRIARAHGGRVEVENRPGEGVTFSLWLPALVP